VPFTIDLAGKVALITGATSGIGFGVISQLAKAGCTVAGCSRGEEQDDERSGMCIAVDGGHSSCTYFQCDVTKKKDIASLISEVEHRFGRLDILVSNAGKNIFLGAEQCSEEEWQYNIDLNLASHWRIAKAAAPLLRRHGEGVILIMTSNHAFQSIPGCFPYNMAKTALTGLVRSLALEWGPAIRAVGIAPGFIDTAGNQSYFDSFDDPAAARQRTEELHPVKRIGTPEEIGALCVFLSGPHARFITGTTITVDGGRRALLQDTV
jgi:NAD(P)-dependent dehydrogenase (short-subunit alcohol dehydrogenase family)